MNIFLDDDRHPGAVTWVSLPPVQWTIVRSYDEFVRSVVQHGIPKRVSFDHDLCTEHYMEYKEMVRERRFRYEMTKVPTGHCALRWLLRQCATKRCARPHFWFHTWNPDGKENMLALTATFDRDNPELVPKFLGVS